MEFCVDGIQCRRNSIDTLITVNGMEQKTKDFFSDYVQEKKIHPPSVVFLIDFGTNAKYWLLSENIQPTTGDIKKWQCNTYVMHSYNK
jgi:hypothetical protein